MFKKSLLLLFCIQTVILLAAPPAPVIFGPNGTVQTLTQNGVLVGQRLQDDGNYVLNPSAFLDATNVAVTNAVVTRSIATPISKEQVAEFNVTFPTAASSIVWTLKPFSEGLKGGNCKTSWKYRGFQASTIFRIRQGGFTIVQENAIASPTNVTQRTLFFACGNLSTSTTFEVVDTNTLTGTNEIADIDVSQVLPVAASGTGDVVGPASATDSAFAQFDTATGKLLKNGPTSLSVLQGGTGGTTQSTARTGLGLGNSATLDTGTTAGTVALGDDIRLTDARSPSGAATGELTGTFPGPVLVTSAVTNKILTGFSVGTNSPVIAADSIIGAFGKVQGQLNAGLPATGAAGGDLAGTYPNPTIATSAVTDAKVASGISGSKISGNITGNAANVTGTVATTNGGTGLSSVGTSLQVLRTNAAATGLEYATISTGGGSGDVVGPVASTDTGFAKFDGTTGKLLKDSAAVVAISDGGTGATSASAARAALGVPQPNRVTFSQTNYTIPAGATYVAQTGNYAYNNIFTVTLPLANSVVPAFEITIVDFSTNIGSNYSALYVATSGGDLTTGVSGVDVIQDRLSPLYAVSDGTSKWLLSAGSSIALGGGNSFLSSIGTKNIDAPFLVGHLSFINQLGFISFRDNTASQSTGSIAFNGNGVSLPVTTTANRPSSPTNGLINFNVDLNKTQIFENSQWNNVIQEASILPKVTVFETSGTFTKETTSKVVIVKMLGGGGGGGSGGRGLTTVIRTGGGGGAGGSYSERSYNAVDLSANETVVVGAAGSGGLGQVTDSTLGLNGAAGGFSSFSTVGNLLRAQGGAAGGQGRITGVAATGGAVGAGNIFNGSAGGASSATGVAGAAGTIANQFAAAGGGGGGGLTAANGAAAGGAGGAGAFLFGSIAGGTGGAAGANGNSSTATTTGTAKGSPGSGGGGGTLNGPGGNGATTVNYGAGGGGGGPSSNTFVSGAGGNGGNGVVVIYEW